VAASLLQAENRRIEPWALDALAYLHHPLRDRAAAPGIRPLLDILPEVQRTGDIFFPASWCRALLGGHRCPEALEAVNDCLSAHPELPGLLRSKVLLASWPLERAVRTTRTDR
jgi:aminopeptidase N